MKQYRTLQYRTVQNFHRFHSLPSQDSLLNISPMSIEWRAFQDLNDSHKTSHIYKKYLDHNVSKSQQCLPPENSDNLKKHRYNA